MIELTARLNMLFLGVLLFIFSISLIFLPLNSGRKNLAYLIEHMNKRVQIFKEVEHGSKATH